MTDRYSIGAVARRTGLSPAVIRMWESRYGAVTPGRTPSGQRRYSDEEVRRLELLKALVDAGHRIGLIATASDEELQEQVETLRRPVIRVLGGRAPAALEEALEAVGALDRERLRAVLDEASVRMGRIEMLDRFLTPLMREIGDRCASGELRMVHEHLATAEVRGFLDGVAGAFPAAPGAPAIVVGTPAWQHHELGALLVAGAARAEGWRVTYLGPNLPASELASAAIEVDARAVGLSITYVDDRESLLGELRVLRRLLSDETELIVGGRGAAELAKELVDMGVTLLQALPDFREELERVRGRRLAG